MRQRISLIAACLLALTLILTSSSQPTHAQTKIILWHSWRDASASVLAGWISDFNAKNKGVEMDAQYIAPADLLKQLESAAPETRPDLVLGPSDWAGDLVKKNIAIPLTDQLGTDFQFTPVTSADASIQGSLVAVPQSLEGIALYYNNTLVDPANIPTTFEELLGQAKQLTKDQTVGLIMPTSFYATAGIYFAYEGTLFDGIGNPTLDLNGAFKNYLTAMQNLYQRGANGEVTLNESSGAFEQGHAAYLIDGSWNLSDYERSLGDHLGVASLPTVNDTAWLPFVRTQQFYFTQTANLTLTVAFAKSAYQADAQQNAAQLARQIPANPAVKVSDQHISAFMSQLSAGTALPNRLEMSMYWEPISAAIDAVTVGGKPIDEAIQKAQSTIQTQVDLLRNQTR